MPTKTGRKPKICEWQSKADALSEFARFGGGTEGGGHIKPLHWYVACRLVIEGGFDPDEITPRPPFVVEKRAGRLRLLYDPASANGKEQCVLGGLKTKNVDVVVSKDGIGPVLAVSCRGMTGAIRNLTNRMEETVGESTNLHISYPSLVFGYMFIIRANKAQAAEATDASSESGAGLKRNDVAIGDDDSPVASLIRFHYALSEMTGRRGIRNDFSRYESVALGVIDSSGKLLQYPPQESKIHFDAFFTNLYLRYEERFVLNAPALKTRTGRKFWSLDSPLFVKHALQSSMLTSERTLSSSIDYPCRIYYPEEAQEHGKRSNK